jgi:hypothetical protein
LFIIYNVISDTNHILASVWLCLQACLISLFI